MKTKNQYCHHWICFNHNNICSKLWYKGQQRTVIWRLAANSDSNCITLLDLFGEIGFVDTVSCLSWQKASRHPMLRQNKAQILYCSTMFIDLPCRFCLHRTGSKYLEYISRIRILNNNRIFESWLNNDQRNKLKENWNEFFHRMIWLNKATEFELKCKICNKCTMNNIHWLS